uniref:Uncharacterized protein n=1 Tax=Oryza glaberrima TaxID=4538 RepID=I1PVV0_ORYGL
DKCTIYSFHILKYPKQNRLRTQSIWIIWYGGTISDTTKLALLDQQENRAAFGARGNVDAVDEKGDRTAAAAGGGGGGATTTGGVGGDGRAPSSAMPRAQGAEKKKAPSAAAPPPTRTAPCGTPAREFKKPVLYSSTGLGEAAGGGRRRAFAEFSSCVVRKAPPLERRVECTLEELCSGCKKEVKYTRDVVAKNGPTMCCTSRKLSKLSTIHLLAH